MKHHEYIKVVDGGNTAVLMIHGIFGTPRHFDDIVDLVPQEWSVYNILLDGHGKGVKDFAHTSMDKWKQQVDKMMAELYDKYDNIYLIGHSMGTLLSLDISAESFIILPICFTASIFIPARVLPIFTDEQTLSVSESA